MSLFAHSVQRDPVEISLYSLDQEEGSKGASKIYGAFPSTWLRPCQIWPSAAWCLGIVSRNREEFWHHCLSNGLHLKTSTIFPQNSTETQDQVATDLACLGSRVHHLPVIKWHQELFGKLSLFNIYRFCLFTFTAAAPEFHSSFRSYTSIGEETGKSGWRKDQRCLSWAGHPTACLPFRLCQRLHCQHHSQERCIIQMLNTNYPVKDQVKLNNGKGVILSIEQIRDDTLSLTFPGAPVLDLPHLVLHPTACAVTAMPGCEAQLSWRSIWKPRCCFTASVLTCWQCHFQLLLSPSGPR